MYADFRDILIAAVCESLICIICRKGYKHFSNFGHSSDFVRIHHRADVAQLVEHFTRNEGVRSSNLLIGSTISSLIRVFG